LNAPSGTAITAGSTGTCPADWRAWWAAESVRVGSDWRGILKQHHVALLEAGRHNGVDLDASACSTCGASPCINPGFCKTCRAADRRQRQKDRPRHDLPQDWESRSLETLWGELDRAAHRRNPAPEKSTVAAIIQAVCARGLGALQEPATAERLARCTPQQRADIKRRIALIREISK
jgi:hypothetical protein